MVAVALSFYGVRCEQTYAAKVGENLIFFRPDVRVGETTNEWGHEVTTILDYRVYKEGLGLSGIVRDYFTHYSFNRRPMPSAQYFVRVANVEDGSGSKRNYCSFAWTFYYKSPEVWDAFSIGSNLPISYLTQIKPSLEELVESDLDGRIDFNSRGFNSRQRLWMNHAGAFVEGTYLSQDAASVRVKSFTGDHWTLQKQQLGEADQMFLKLIDAHPSFDVFRKDHEEAAEAFAFESNPMPESSSFEATLLKPYVEDALFAHADRSAIPSFNQSDYRGGSYSCGPASLLNFIVWWADNYFPELYPETGRREQHIKQIQRRLITLCSARRGTYGDELMEGMKAYFQEYAPGFDIEVEAVIAPSREWLERSARGLNAVIVSHGYYEESGGRLRRQTGHYTSVMNCNGDTVTLNTWGQQFVVQLKGVPMRTIESCRTHWWLKSNARCNRLWEYADASSVGLLRPGMRGFLETGFVFKIRPVAGGGVAGLN